MLAGATGVPYTGQGLMKTGEEIIALEREYNGRNGFSEQDDLLPERFFTEEGSSGEGIDVPALDRARFTEELERYYRIRGQT
jgi:aldehyde:ferredoxin oxidoreductase